ncbi:tRNA G18 (ribose-2'-O)-methylase SpoU [Proteiniphilum saccharofermentans]|jgi:TrmH family RNA methyltransferase|uniref:tRNA G18 (Ribose-2'-O)-methylase SpoU n=1 Tax=Proteiniphilum saccharofermentans TaxID=1642647 RepID=A0A1R3SUK7_9BACT|nr:RNA methyltransferase [Proteiniphilum saccharofermentans]SCD19993.1 tRNA G18 (ribose-2'-O)-methylase SpoU [Proteiniphilum saccharofermentans]
MSLSKNKIKYIRSLNEKKFRNEHNTFVAEGTKLVFDLLRTCRCQLIAALPSILSSHPELKAEEIIAADENELKKATFLKTAPQIIGVFYRPSQEIEKIDFSNQLCLVLEGIQDPGNMGTIIRIADWFGIEHIISSYDSVDIFNPKTVQATMGAIARIKVFYTDIKDLLRQQSHSPIYGTFLEGEDIYSTSLSNNGFIVMGSEGRGISRETEKLINKKLFIPNFPEGRATSESLNVATATAITCAEFRRRSRS